MNKKLVLLGATMLLTAASASAQKRVTGRVLDTDGQPIIGATVRVAGHKGVAVTDGEGRFQLQNVPASAQHLRITYIGKEEQTVSISGNVRVVLKDNDNTLDEAIVVGYGKVKKGDFTGSVTAVKGDQLEKVQVSNVTKALEGMIPGLQTTSSTGQPGSSASIFVRGIGSISANTEPLIILDGTPYEGAMSSINPMDIESINLQKDASATSIYGARGANGILYITTKKGRAGRTRVTLDAKWGWNERGVSKYETIENAGDYYQIAWESLRNQYANKNGMSDLQARISASRDLVKTLGGYNAFNVADNQLIDPLTGLVNPAASLLYGNEWEDASFHNGMRQEYNLGMSGGDDRTQYYLSFNYLSDKAYVKKSDFERLTGRLRIDHKAFEWLNLGASVSYANSTTNGLSASSGKAANLFSFTDHIAPIYPVYLRDQQGNLVLDADGNTQFDLGNAYGRTRLFSLSQNPLINVYNNQEATRRDAFTGRAYAEVAILDGLTARVDLGVDNFNSEWNSFTSPITADAAASKGYGYKEMSRSTVVNATQRLNYDKTFGKHSIGLMAAHETKTENSVGLGAYRKYFFLNENNFSYSLLNADAPSSSDNNYHLESYLGRAEYSYNHLYNFSASYRRDRSSMFHPDKNVGHFWSVGGAWNIGLEDWFKQSLGHIVSNLKLRASYGTQGNDGIDVYGGWLDHYSVSNAGTDDNPEFAIVKTYLGNPDLTWEKSKTFDVGLEAGFFNNRLNVEFDFFVKNTDDMIGYHSLPSSQGSPSSILTNEQAMRNTGFEAQISGTIIKKSNIVWTAQVNMTHYKNEMTRLQEGRPAEGYQSGDYWRKKGNSYYDWYMARYAGVDPNNGDALYFMDVEVPTLDEAGNPILDENGVAMTHTEMQTTNDANKATRYELGKSALPALFGGISTSVQAYGFDLSVQMAYSLGGWTYDGNYAGLMGDNMSNGGTYSTDIYKRWQKPGDITDVPRLETGYRMTGGVTNDRFLTRSDYFSIRNITLGYTLPQHIVANVPGLTSVRVYAMGDNLFLGSKRKGLDPRQYLSGTVDRNSYSALRTISFGLTLNF